MSQPSRHYVVRAAASALIVCLIAPWAAQADDAPETVATIRVMNRQGKPMNGARVFITVKTAEYAPKRLVDGKLSDDGTFDIPRPDDIAEVRQFIVNVDARTSEVGRFALADVPEDRLIEFTMPPRQGDVAPDIVMEGLFSGERVNLSSFRGQVVLLDFWASWCGPCQEPMAHNQDVMTRRAADWEGKAAIVALSVDDTKQAAADHIQDKGWTAFLNVWSGEGAEAGWNSAAPRIYGIESIPTALLIGPDGQVLWRGHPGQVDIEEKIDAAIAR